MSNWADDDSVAPSYSVAEYDKALHIERALAKSAQRVDRIAIDRWRFQMVNGQKLPGILRRDKYGIVAELGLDRRLPAGELCESIIWRMLETNQRLKAGLKLAMDTNGRPRVQLEFVEAESFDDGLLAERLSDMRQAAVDFHEVESKSRLWERVERAAVAMPSSQEIRCICDEARWPCRQRSNGKVVAELELAGEKRNADIEPHADGLRLETRLRIRNADSSCSREAIGRLLLSANHAVRMVRAAGEYKGHTVTAWFEVIIAATPQDLAHALSALSVACGLCACEAEALTDASVAELFLEMAHTQRACASMTAGT